MYVLTSNIILGYWVCIILTVFKNFCFIFFLQKSLHHYYKLLLSLVCRLFFASFFSQNYQHHHFHIHIVSMRLVTQIFSYFGGSKASGMY